MKEIREKLKVARARREPIRFLTEEEKVALAKGNSDEMIRVNKEKFDYSGVKESDRLMAEKWFKATKPSAGPAYHQWRVWNVPYNYENEGEKKNDKYKGDLIIEKATGRSTEGEQEDIEFDEGDEEVGEEVREATVAMAGVRVE